MQASNINNDTNNNGNNVVQDGEGLPDEVEQVLKSYQVIFDIHSLRDIATGYPVYCRGWSFNEFTTMTLRGIPAALIGDFKVGKTFLTGKLLDLTTPADQVLQTPGICVATKLLTNKASKPQAAPRARQRGFKQVSKPANAPTPPPADSNVREFDFILLDTAGTDMPTSMTALKDTRATEVFLRTLILHLAERVIFVTKKFDRPTQEKLVNLVKQLRKCGKEVSSQRRILVVHNLADIGANQSQAENKTIKEVLNERIALVQSCYTTIDTTIEILEDEESIGDSSVTWAAKTYEGVQVYDTALVSHFFMVNDTALAAEDFNPKDYNASVIKALIAKLYETNPINLPMLQNLVKTANQQLYFFLDKWSQSHVLMPVALETSSQHGGLLPYSFAQDRMPEHAEGQPPPNDFFLHEQWRNALDPAELSPWPLTRMKFVDSGVMSEAMQDLTGTWFVNKATNKFLIYVRAAGFSKEKCSKDNIRLVWDRTDNWVEVHVRLDTPVPPEGYTQVVPAPIVHAARGVYRCVFPENERYLLPRNTNFYNEEIAVSNGEIWISLDIEVDVLAH